MLVVVINNGKLYIKLVFGFMMEYLILGNKWEIFIVFVEVKGNVIVCVRIVGI